MVEGPGPPSDERSCSLVGAVPETGKMFTRKETKHSVESAPR